MDKKYTVFVSSTYEDLKEERQEVMQALLEMDCIPCGMELFPAADEEQFAFIKSIIDDCDYYVLILGGRYGSVDSNGVGYTELEFKYALERNIPTISFIHGDPDSIPYSKCEHDEETIKKLNDFRALAKMRMCKFWTNKVELAGIVSRSMIQLIKRHPAIGWVRANLVPKEDALMKITKLYEENSELKNNNVNRTSEKALASGQDCFDVAFGIYDKNEYVEEENISFKVKMSWNDILRVLGPSLIEERTNYGITKCLNRIVTQKYLNELKDTGAIRQFKESKRIEVSEQSVGEIIVQFLALDYIRVNHPNHNNDFDMSHDSTYVLTEQGRNILIHLVAKRK